ncbi:MAG: TRAP transporter small permease subunit [Cellulomonadaceae bacterium]|nr:TRAP transporter small permease subunit [Cellulomonadaceae bacterium]
MSVLERLRADPLWRAIGLLDVDPRRVALAVAAGAGGLGSAVGLEKGYQVSVNLLVDRLAPLPLLVLRGCMYAGMLVFLGLMTWFGILQTIVNSHQYSPAIGMPMSLPYLALPVGFALMFLITVEQWLRVARPAAQGR